MVEKQDNVYYYITLLNENYPMPGLQPGTEEQIVKGMYLCKEGATAGQGPQAAPRVQLLGSGTILRESARRAGTAGKGLGRCAPTSGAARASTNWRATARTPSARTCCIRRKSPAYPS